MNVIKIALLTAGAMVAPVAMEGEEAPASEPVSEETSTSLAVSSSEEASSDEDAFDFGDWLKETFTPEVIASIVSCITAIAAILKMASSLKDLATKHSNTSKEVVDTIKNILPDETEREIERLVTPISNDMKQMKEVLNQFAKILALQQENTPEARVAILQLIQQLGTLGDDVTNLAGEAQKVVSEQTKALEEKKEAQSKALEEVASSYDGTSI